MVVIPFIQILGAIVTIGARLTGVVLFAPFFGSMAIPARVKAFLVVAMTALLYPMTSPKIPAMNIAQWPITMLGELIIGAGVGIASNLVFDGVQMAGQLLGIQMGYSLVNLMDPQTQVESTVMAQFHQTIAMLIFLQLNVQLWILRALTHSFDYLPPASMHLRGAFVTALLHAGASVFSTGIQIAAPVLSATLIADLALGILGKASPQLPLMLLGPAIKSILGILILISAIKYWPDQFERFFLQSTTLADHLLHLAS